MAIQIEPKAFYSFSSVCNATSPKVECRSLESDLANAPTSVIDKMFNCPPGKHIVPGLLSLIDELSREINTDPKYKDRELFLEVKSGYRTPGNNKQSGGERNSYHLQGKAADIKIYYQDSNGQKVYIPAKYLFNKAKEIMDHHGFGGVGYYPHEGFIHMDCRDWLFAWAR